MCLATARGERDAVRDLSPSVPRRPVGVDLSVDAIDRVQRRYVGVVEPACVGNGTPGRRGVRLPALPDQLREEGEIAGVQHGEHRALVPVVDASQHVLVGVGQVAHQGVVPVVRRQVE